MGPLRDHPLDSLAFLRIETDGRKPVLQHALERTAGEALAEIPRLYPGVRVLGSHLAPDYVEMLLDLGVSDEDLPRLVQNFKRRVRSLAETKEPLWQREHVEILGADPAQHPALLAAWPGLRVE